MRADANDNFLHVGDMRQSGTYTDLSFVQLRHTVRIT